MVSNANIVNSSVSSGFELIAFASTGDVLCP